MKYKCDKCGQPTDNIYRYKDHFGAKFLDAVNSWEKETHTCDECEQKADDYKEWQNEQFQERKIICPWCGYENGDSWEYEDSEDEVECGECGRLFDLEVETEVHYTTRKSDSEYDKDDA